MVVMLKGPGKLYRDFLRGRFADGLQKLYFSKVSGKKILFESARDSSWRFFFFFFHESCGSVPKIAKALHAKLFLFCESSSKALRNLCESSAKALRSFCELLRRPLPSPLLGHPRPHLSSSSPLSTHSPHGRLLMLK